MTGQKTLFTIGIVSYNNYKYIYEAIDSVLMQDYENIELIVSNDASSDFQMEKLKAYIEKNKGPNITALHINNNEENLGTVKNINYVRSHAHGEIIMYMAADDGLYKKDVVSRFVREFEKLGENAYVVSSLTAMCGNELDDIVSYAPDEDGVCAIKNDTPQQLFSRISHTFTIPTTSTAYRMSLYEKIGGYDEDYYIIEDAVIYAKMCRLGIKVYWIDNMIAACHRDGGISHGNTANLSEAYRKYKYDEIRLYDKEVWPYKNLLSPEDFKKFKFKYDYVKRVYFETFLYPNMSTAERMLNKFKHTPIILWHMVQRLVAQTFALVLSKELLNTMLSVAVVSFVIIFLVVIGMPISLSAFSWHAIVSIGKISLLGVLGLLLCKLVGILAKSLRFIIVGK